MMLPLSSSVSCSFLTTAQVLIHGGLQPSNLHVAELAADAFLMLLYVHNAVKQVEQSLKPKGNGH